MADLWFPLRVDCPSIPARALKHGPSLKTVPRPIAFSKFKILRRFFPRYFTWAFALNGSDNILYFYLAV